MHFIIFGILNNITVSCTEWVLNKSLMDLFDLLIKIQNRTSPCSGAEVGGRPHILRSTLRREARVRVQYRAAHSHPKCRNM